MFVVFLYLAATFKNNTAVICHFITSDCLLLSSRRISRPPNLPKLNSTSAKPSASRYLPAPSIPHVSETHSIQPLRSPTSSFTCSQIYFSLSLQPWSAHFPSLPPPLCSLGDSLITLYQSGLCGGQSAVQHSVAQSAPISATQPPSLSQSLLKRCRLPDIVCPPPRPRTLPSPATSCPTAGQEAAGLDLTSLDIQNGRHLFQTESRTACGQI